MLSLAEALAALPDTADGIATHLHAAGIKGRRRAACGCPLAEYLLSLGLTDPVVSHAGICAVGTHGRQRHQLRNAVREFLTRFDAGEWPELDSEPEADDA